jgi:hypothetical protein
VAGEDYCIVAADTRMSTGFSIMTRDCKKIMQLCAPSAHAPQRTTQKVPVCCVELGCMRSTAREPLCMPGIGLRVAVRCRLRHLCAHPARSDADLHARGARARLVRVAAHMTRPPDARFPATHAALTAA